MKKIVAIVILLLTAITFSTHIAYTEEKGITIFPKESFNFAYTFVDVDELRKEAQEMGMLATISNKSMIYILTRYRQYENKEYKSNTITQ